MEAYNCDFRILRRVSVRASEATNLPGIPVMPDDPPVFQAVVLLGRWADIVYHQWQSSAIPLIGDNPGMREPVAV